jgi:vacuolar protein sorting-associated protein 33A
LLHARTSTVKPVYSTLRKSLRLIVDEVNEQNPDDVAYVYSGYAPLSIRLVQCIIQKHVIIAGQAETGGRLAGAMAGLSGAMGWRGFEEPLKLVKGRTFDEIQRQEDQAVRAKRTAPHPPFLGGN